MFLGLRLQDQVDVETTRAFAARNLLVVSRLQASSLLIQDRPALRSHRREAAPRLLLRALVDHFVYLLLGIGGVAELFESIFLKLLLIQRPHVQAVVKFFVYDLFVEGGLVLGE